MKVIVKLFVFSLIALPTFSQTLAEADSWFDSYEYERAAKSFEKIENRTELSSEDYQRWCYSYFISGNYDKSFQLSESLIKDASVPAYFYYVHGFSAMALGNYSLAKNSFEVYKKNDTEYDLDSLIVSCEKIPSWTPEIHISQRNEPFNNGKSNFSGSQFNDGRWIFHEKGTDEKGIAISDSLLEKGELMYMRPFLLSNQTAQSFNLPEEFNHFNLTSFAYDAISDEVYVTLNNPISENEALRSPHIYKGKLVDNSFEALIPWEYSGLGDSTSTAHATINASGNLMVFAKQGEKTAASDLYYSKKVDGTWKQPVPFTALNSNQDEMFPLFMGDSLLSFASNGRVGYGGLDIYLAVIDNNQLVSISHPKAPINSFDDDFNFSYFQGSDSAYYSSNRSGGKGDDDVYFIQFREKEEVDTTEYNEFIDNWKDIIVYFDFDKFNLNDDNKSRINELKIFMDRYKNLKLKVAGHTDIRGTDEYNMQLGSKRAATVKDILVSLGIQGEQIEVVSKGRKSPAIDCSKGCSEEEHRLNRFAAIQLIDYK